MRETARRISAAFENEPFRFLCAWVEPIVNCLSVISFENCMERLAYDFCGNVLFFFSIHSLLSNCLSIKSHSHRVSDSNAVAYDWIDSFYL